MRWPGTRRTAGERGWSATSQPGFRRNASSRVVSGLHEDEPFDVGDAHEVRLPTRVRGVSDLEVLLDAIGRGIDRRTTCIPAFIGRRAVALREAAKLSIRRGARGNYRHLLALKSIGVAKFFVNWTWLRRLRRACWI